MLKTKQIETIEPDKTTPYLLQGIRLSQGYDLFDCEGTLEIQKVDDTEELKRFLGRPPSVSHRNDDDALDHAKKQAANGCPAAKDAIARNSKKTQSRS